MPTDLPDNVLPFGETRSRTLRRLELEWASLDEAQYDLRLAAAELRDSPSDEAPAEPVVPLAAVEARLRHLWREMQLIREHFAPATDEEREAARVEALYDAAERAKHRLSDWSFLHTEAWWEGDYVPAGGEHPLALPSPAGP